VGRRRWEPYTVLASPAPALSVASPSCQLSSGASRDVNSAASPPAIKYLKHGRRPVSASNALHACRHRAGDGNGGSGVAGEQPVWGCA
jgi:hypothetical protein